MNKHRSACLHSALAHRGIQLYKTTGKDANTKTLNMRYSGYEERNRQRQRETDRQKERVYVSMCVRACAHVCVCMCACACVHACVC